MTFQAGKSGNPAGRPVGSKAFADMLRIAITEAHEEGKNKLRGVVDGLLTKAIAGDVNAIREVADRLDGKVPQGVQNEGDQPFKIETVLRWQTMEESSGAKS